ncbi:MAG: DUF1254 domain-containing protein [Candidatus Competibacteraceae bacterium]|nr:DUF1254 domain-containing protein [Candidatus Competibacteraceae bacterium]MCB1808140.1 DUF1254 domain-containing protein [Candidatus Competibacteraceae bacterium]MCB1811483.1 DUF1254 domain-containing protein [Candidatus Competibacteraceae bacterium]
MKATTFTRLALTSLMAAGLTGTAWAQAPKLKMTTEIPASTRAADEVHTSIGTIKYFDGVPTEETVNTVYDYLDRARAVNVYLNSIPALSINALREGQASAGCITSNQVCIFDTLMDSKSLFLTGNTSTMYAIGFLDLAKDGPTVVDLPTRMLGVLDDMEFKYMIDLGVAGPDKGQGGKFLVLPPGYKGEVPEGYFVVRSNTYGVWLFMRGYLDKGIQAASENIRNNLKVYPLAQASNPPKMAFINISGKEMNTVLPNDYSAFEKLHTLIQQEPEGYLGPEAKGMMAAIGIEKGKPFTPDDRMKKILMDAADIGNAAARAISYFPRDTGNLTYGKDSAWVIAYADKDTAFTRNGAYRLDPRVLFHFGYIVVSPAMAVTVPGKGSDYAMAMLDAEQQALDGSKTYKLNLPANIPVKDFWAVTMYDTQTRSQLQTDQQFPTLDSYRKGMKKNADGSIDIYFSPQPPTGQDNNWLQTVPGKSWFIALRVYGPEEAWIKQTWRPGEIELVE